MAHSLSRSNLERRLQKLEAVLTDDSCAVPHTHKWLLYWTEQIGKYVTGERRPIGKFATVGGVARRDESLCRTTS